MNNTNFNVRQKNNTKIIFLLIIVIAIGVGIFFLFKWLNNSKELAKLNDIFDPNKPIIIEKNGKYGYISSNGEMMIEPKYDSVGSFEKNYAIVTLDDEYQIIDKSGNVINDMKIYGYPNYESEYNIWVINHNLYDSDLKPILDEEIEVNYIKNGFLSYVDRELNESGIINYKGKKIFSWEGTKISVNISNNIYNKDDLLARVVKTYERDVIVNLKTGKIIYKVEDAKQKNLSVKDNNIFKEYNSDSGDVKILFFVDGKLIYESSDLYNLELYDYQNQILKLDYGYNYDDFGRDQRYYYYDIKNKKILDENPSLADLNIENNLIESIYGYKIFTDSDKYGLMLKNKIIIPCEYDYIKFLSTNLFKYMKSKGQEIVILENDKKSLLLNLKNKKTIATFDSTSIYNYENSTFLKVNVYEKYSISSYIIYNLLSGKSISIDKDSEIDIYSNYITVTNDNTKTYYNTKLEQIYVENL